MSIDRLLRTGLCPRMYTTPMAIVAGALMLMVSAMALPATANAEDLAVDVELVLAVDVSWSMDFEEQRLQRDGYAAAFRHPAVIDAIRHGGWGRIAVTYVEWAGSYSQVVVVPWTIIETPEDAEAFAASLSQEPISKLRRTSISEAMAFAADRFADNQVAGLRRVIDISGDGPNNQGRAVLDARDEVIASGIIINGLPILIGRPGSFSFFDIADLDIYYEDCVIGGFGAFIVPVRAASQFAEAIRRKLVLEIAGVMPEIVPAQVQTSEPRIDCLIGEKIWQRRRRFFDEQ